MYDTFLAFKFVIENTFFKFFSLKQSHYFKLIIILILFVKGYKCDNILERYFRYEVSNLLKVLFIYFLCLTGHAEYISKIKIVGFYLLKTNISCKWNLNVEFDFFFF